MKFLPKTSALSYKSNSFLNTIEKTPELAMLSSAILPGSGQALSGKWGRAAGYFLVEVITITYFVNKNAEAKRKERAYEAYANKNWSVLAYAQWLIDYSQVNGLDNDYQVLQAELAELGPTENTPNFENTTDDWRKVNLNTLRRVERKTPFIFNIPSGCGSNDPPDCLIKSNFSHVVQDYGSQQYYELMSKYFQFQPGWKDFHNQRINNTNHTYQYMWDKTMMSANFIEGKNRAFEFNDDYRKAGNIVKLLIVNHVISAFDALLSGKLKNYKLETSTNLIGEESFSLTWHF